MVALRWEKKVRLVREFEREKDTSYLCRAVQLNLWCLTLWRAEKGRKDIETRLIFMLNYNNYLKKYDNKILSRSVTGSYGLPRHSFGRQPEGG